MYTWITRPGILGLGCSLLLHLSVVLTVVCAAEHSPLSSAGDLDAIVAQEQKLPQLPALADDATFLRRVTLDLAGRLPTLEEQSQFAAEVARDKRSRLIDALLENPEFGEQWGGYWVDVISAQVAPADDDLYIYSQFHSWLAQEFARDRPWDEIVRDMLVSTGELKDKPQLTFLAFHRGELPKTTGETTRVFLSTQIACAECHDHPFDVWKRDQFHQMAAAFSQVRARIDNTSIRGRKIEADARYRLPVAKDPKKYGDVVTPVSLDGQSLSNGDSREQLARWITQPDNPWFADAYTNRIWARLIGKGFVEPLDDLSERNDRLLRQTHRAMARYFVQKKFSTKALFRLICNTQYYQRAAKWTDLNTLARFWEE
jgi:hypothetical protein